MNIIKKESNSLIVRLIPVLALLFSFSFEVMGQQVKKSEKLSVSTVQSYIDSLVTYRQRLDSAIMGDKSLCDSLLGRLPQRTEYNNVISPLTFYHDIASRQFAITDSTKYTLSDVDRILLMAYINHPDLVIDSEKSLQKAGGITVQQTAPVKNDVEFTNEQDTPAATPEQEHFDDIVNIVTSKPNFWSYKGDYSLQFLQNYVSENWYKGGESNYSMIGAVKIEANYDNKQKIKWDNMLEMKLGMQTTKGDSIHSYKSSEDLLRLTSKLGLQATKRWYYTLQGLAYTQFTRSYKSNDKFVYSDIFSPLNVNLALGMDYKMEWLKKRLTGTINISPLAANFKYVDRLALSKKNGLDEGKHTLWDFGSTFTADFTWKFTNDVKWRSRFYGYTTYHRAQVEWENTFTFQLSKYISTNVFVYPRFDDSTQRDDKLGYIQLKEYWSLGFNYSF